MASEDHGIHSFDECVLEGSDYFQKNLGRAHTRWSSTHNKRRWEKLKIECSWFKEDPSSVEKYEELNSWRPSYASYIWIRNDAIMNEEDDEAERRSLPMKQIKISIQLSFHDIILLCIFHVQLMCYAW